jgi:hypothetical protein
MNITLTKNFEDMIARLVAGGRDKNASGVVGAGFLMLDAEEKSLAAPVLPAGSLGHLYSKTDNLAERRTGHWG